MNGMVRTSISLPAATIERLRQCERGFDRMPGLAKSCIRKQIRHMKMQVDERATCRYNPVGPHEKVNIWLTPEEHHTLKAYRMMLNISVSYLFALAIDKYLMGIANTSVRFWHPRYAPGWNDWFDGNLAQMGHIHRKIVFRNDRSILAMSVVMLRPRWKGRFIRSTRVPPGTRGFHS